MRCRGSSQRCIKCLCMPLLNNWWFIIFYASVKCTYTLPYYTFPFPALIMFDPFMLLIYNISRYPTEKGSVTLIRVLNLAVRNLSVYLRKRKVPKNVGGTNILFPTHSKTPNYDELKGLILAKESRFLSSYIDDTIISLLRDLKANRIHSNKCQLSFYFHLTTNENRLDVVAANREDPSKFPSFLLHSEFSPSSVCHLHAIPSQHALRTPTAISGLSFHSSSFAP